MVKAEFLIQIEAPLESVWNFYGKFENVAQWDPNIIRCILLKQNNNIIGSIYDIIANPFSIQQKISYQILKHQKGQTKAFWAARGQNSMLRAYDQLILTKKSQDLTELNYKVDLQLKGFYWAFTPFFYWGVHKLRIQGREGCFKKANQLFGKARQIK